MNEPGRGWGTLFVIPFGHKLLLIMLMSLKIPGPRKLRPKWDWQPDTAFEPFRFIVYFQVTFPSLFIKEKEKRNATWPTMTNEYS